MSGLAGWSQPVDATLCLKGEMECALMGRRFHRGFTATEKTELWDRWKRGESLKAIGRAFGKPSSSIYFLVAPHGGSSCPAASLQVGIDACGTRGDFQRRYGTSIGTISGMPLRIEDVADVESSRHPDHGGETQWDHYGRCRLSVCARQRDLGYVALSASVAIGRPCEPSRARMMPASYA